ncbi:hypothetical protein [Calothrix sp. 336/3]|uniref:hypothetical protein n=1 Tax=Calothrix sp. 336/3 TaxID=1337936 RepID=UPI00143C504B|nr:hypothetical protein [Calothrix sp. 336/3]
MSDYSVENLQSMGFHSNYETDKNSQTLVKSGLIDYLANLLQSKYWELGLLDLQHFWEY